MTRCYSRLALRLRASLPGSNHKVHLRRVLPQEMYSFLRAHHLQKILPIVLSVPCRRTQAIRVDPHLRRFFKNLIRSDHLISTPANGMGVSRVSKSYPSFGTIAHSPASFLTDAHRQKTLAHSHIKKFNVQVAQLQQTERSCSTTSVSSQKNPTSRLARRQAYSITQ
jgi:hypothetical protein